LHFFRQANTRRRAYQTGKGRFLSGQKKERRRPNHLLIVANEGETRQENSFEKGGSHPKLGNCEFVAARESCRKKKKNRGPPTREGGGRIATRTGAKRFFGEASQKSGRRGSTMSLPTGVKGYSNGRILWESAPISPEGGLNTREGFYRVQKRERGGVCLFLKGGNAPTNYLGQKRSVSVFFPGGGGGDESRFRRQAS